MAVAFKVAQIKLRLPIGLKLQIDKAAEQNRRSLNGEIVARLEEIFGVTDQGRKGAVKTDPDLDSNHEKRLRSVEKSLADVLDRLEILEAADKN
jgi:hypothetical protein